MSIKGKNRCDDIIFSDKPISQYPPFINIKWGTENVLQNTIDNFATTKLRYKLLDKKIDIDTIFDIENRK